MGKSGKKAIVDKNILYDLTINKKLNQHEIAKLLDICVVSVRKYQKEYKLSIPKNNDIDLTGKVFARLTVIGFDHRDKYSFWKCKCECGKETVVRYCGLTSGQIRSCGCYRTERIRERNSKPFGESAFNNLIYTYKRNAKKKQSK